VKILHLASEYPPQKVFGLGRFVHGLAREQARQGHEVHVVTNSMGGRQHETEECGVHVHRVDFPPPPEPAHIGATVTQFNTQLIERILRDAVCPEAHVVNSHDYLTALAGKVVARRLGATFVVTVHDTVVGKRFGKLNNDAKYAANIEHWMYQLADRIICVSEHTRNEVVERYGAPQGKTFAIHNAVSEEDFPTPDPRLLARFRRVLARDDEKIVLYVGRLDREKGVDVLVRAFARVRDVPAKLVVAGKGKLEPGLRKLAADLGIADRTVFAGYLVGQVLSHAYRGANVLVVPSLYEPFGIVALEGMVCGLPVVASSTGGLTEVVNDGETGLLALSGDEEDLSRTLELVLRDDVLASRLGEHAKERALSEYSWSSVSTRLSEIIDDPGNTPVVSTKATHTTSVGPLKRNKGRIALLVQTHEPDFPLLEANRPQLESLVADGHVVAILCYGGEAAKLPKCWRDIAQVVEADIPRGHDYLVHKVAAGYKAAIALRCDWVVKIDADTLISGSMPDFLDAYPSADLVGAPSSFGPVLEAIKDAGPPQVRADCLSRTKQRYVRGFFFCARRDALARALPLVEGMAPRMRVEDAVVTAAMVETGSRVEFVDFIPRYVTREDPTIDLRSPVLHVESRDAEERQFFVERASALFNTTRTLRSDGPSSSLAHADDAPALDLSVVMHVRDRKSLLLRLLATLRSGWPEDGMCEMLIVDYGGSDGLSADLRELEWPGLRYIYVDMPGRFSSAHARNIAYRASRGRWILSLDGDLLAPPGMVGKVLQTLRKHPGAAVYGPVYKLMPREQDALEAGRYDPVADFARLQEVSTPHRIDAPSGAIIAAPRDRILAVGGYDEGFVGYGFQDIDLIERLRLSGLPQMLPDDIFALHQFHGYPADYNTAEIEAENRRRFVSSRSTIKRNAERPWGRLPQGEVDLQAIDWLESRRSGAKNATPAPTPGGTGVVVWCEDAAPDEVALVKSAARSSEAPGMEWRWLSSVPLRGQRSAATLADLPVGHRFEVHSTAQATTQLGRAGLVIVLGSSSHAGEIEECGRRLKANVVAVGSHASDDIPLAESPSDLAKCVEASCQGADRDMPVRDARIASGSLSSVRKILVGMDEGIGNMVMLTPTLKALHSLLPEADIHVVGRRPALDVLEGMPGITRVIGAKDKPDATYDVLLVTYWRRSVETRLQGIRFGHKPILAERMRLDVHESEQHMQLARALGYGGAVPSPYCAQEPVDMGRRAGPRIGLADCANPRPEWQRKRWPHYRELAKLLLDKGYQVFAFGGKEDARLYERDPWPDRVESYQGRLSIRQTARALAQMGAVVANDCGLAHVAAAVGAPTVCLWGPTSEAKNEPIGSEVSGISLELPCSPCQMTSRWSQCANWQCMKRIAAGEVLREVESRLPQASGGGGTDAGRCAAEAIRSRPVGRGSVEKLLFVGVFNERSTNPSQARAFEKLGVNVSRYDYRKRAREIGVPARDSEIIGTCQQFRPDLVFLSKCNDVGTRVVHECNRISSTALWYMDPLNGNFTPGLIEKIKACTFTCCALHDPYVEAKKYGSSVFFLHEGFDPDCDFPAQAEPKHDVSFIGSLRGERADYHKALEFHVYSNTYGRNHAVAVAESRINLNFTEGGASDRVYKVLAAGGALLTQPWPEMEHDFRVGTDLDIFNSVGELTDKIDWYLGNPAKRHELASAGRATVQAYGRDQFARAIIGICSGATTNVSSK